MTEFDFKFNLPKGWEDLTVYVFSGPKEDNYEHRLMLAIDRHLQHETVKKFADQQTEIIKENLLGMEVLKEKEITIEGGNPAYEFVCKWVPGNDFVVYKKYVFVIHDKRGFTFNCDFTKKTYQMLGNKVNELIEQLLPGTYNPLDD